MCPPPPQITGTRKDNDELFAILLKAAEVMKDRGGRENFQRAMHIYANSQKYQSRLRNAALNKRGQYDPYKI